MSEELATTEEQATLIESTEPLEGPLQFEGSAESKDAPAAGDMSPSEEEELSLLVKRISRIERASRIELACTIGELVVQKFYGGSYKKLLKDGDPKTEPSLRKLADHPDLEFSAPTLYRYIRVYILITQLQKHFPDEVNNVSLGKHLTYTHLRTVIGLDFKDQQRLIVQAKDKVWTVDDLKGEVRKTRESRQAAKDKKRASGVKGSIVGRPRLPAYRKGINSLGKMMKDKVKFFGELEAVKELDPGNADKLFEILKDVMAEMQNLITAIQPRTSAGLSPSEPEVNE